MFAVLSMIPGQVFAREYAGRSVIDFGATPGDSVDDTAAIQNALDQEDHVFIPSGVFLVTSLHVRRNGVSIVGSGIFQGSPLQRGMVLLITGSDNSVRGVEIRGNAVGAITGAENDAIRITGDRNRIIATFVNGSAGSGIRIDGGAGNLIADNRVENVAQNSLIIANEGANHNIVRNNRFSGTQFQNNVFVTASDGSQPTSVRLIGNIIRENLCLDAYDTGIESGQNADKTQIINNTIAGSRNPAILLRDGRGVIVTGNVIIDSTNNKHLVEHTGIAVVPLFEPSSFYYGAVIENNRIDLNIVRSGIYIGGSGVKILQNIVRGRTSQRGYGITLAGDVGSIDISENRLSFFERAIDLNFDGLRRVRRNIVVSANTISNSAIEINRYNIN